VFSIGLLAFGIWMYWIGGANDNTTLILTLNDYLDTFNDNTNNNKTSTSNARLNDNTVT
jgi:hypothetical protein